MKIGISATEPSGDLLGAELMSALQKHSGNSFQFFGIGGAAMQTAGLKSLFATEELAVMGLTAFLASIPKGYQLAKKLVKHLKEKEIDALIIIDSPEFNHPVARWSRAENSKLQIFNLVAPTVWAWRSWRARKMKPYINEVLAILPFEPRVFSDLGGPPCTFVGHPSIDRARRFDMTGPTFRKKHSVSSDQPVLLMLPGSRKGEITRHMEVFCEAIKRFSDVVSDVQIVMPVASHVKDEVALQLKKQQIGVLQIEDEDEKWGAFRAADLALAASGTVTLELAATQTPMVVAYRVDAIVSFIGRFPRFFSWLFHSPTVALPNLIMQGNDIAEFIDKKCTPEALSSAMIEIYQSEKVKKKQIQYLTQAALAVGGDDEYETADRAALAIIRRLKLDQK